MKIVLPIDEMEVDERITELREDGADMPPFARINTELLTDKEWGEILSSVAAEAESRLDRQWLEIIDAALAQYAAKRGWS